MQRFVFERIKNRLIILDFWVRYNQMKKKKIRKMGSLSSFSQENRLPEAFFPDRT